MAPRGGPTHVLLLRNRDEAHVLEFQATRFRAYEYGFGLAGKGDRCTGDIDEWSISSDVVAGKSCIGDAEAA